MPHTNNKDGARSYNRQSAGGRQPKAPADGGPRWKGKKKDSAAVFDDAARAEYLTGFSKRKKERTEAARARAVEREKVEKRELRKQLRDTRKGQVENNLKEQAEYYGTDAFAQDATGSDAEEFDAEVEDQNREYEGSGRRTTVTVEDFSVDHDELAPSRPTQRPRSAPFPPSEAPRTKPLGRSSAHSGRPKSSVSGGSANKNKKKRVPYESKATRTIERAKKERKRASKKEGKRR